MCARVFTQLSTTCSLRHDLTWRLRDLIRICELARSSDGRTAPSPAAVCQEKTVEKEAVKVDV